MATFSVYYNNNPLKSYDLSDQVVTIGRLPENTICIASMSVSRRHVKIEIDTNGVYVLNDLNSLNGTFINRNRVKQTPLKSGDEITIGKYKIVFSIKTIKGETDSFPLAIQDSDKSSIGNSQSLSDTQEQELAAENAESNFAVTASNDAVLIETNKHVVYKLEKVMTTLGNSESDDIFVAGMFIGSGQVSIEKQNDGFWVRCSKAFGKVKINGKKEKEWRLQHKDKVEIGENTFRYMENG